MWYVVAAIIALGVAFSLVGCRETPSPVVPPETKVTVAPDTAKGVPRVEIAAKLAKLATSKPPTKLAQGAMCYEVMAPPDRMEYVCPACGEKTLYATEGEGASPDAHAAIATMQFELEGCRRLAKQIAGLDLALDESAFCRKCTPEGQAPRLCLVVRYAGQDTPHRAEGISTDDLVLIQEFLAGKDRHVSADWESPLKKHLSRLQFLLGFEQTMDRE